MGLAFYDTNSNSLEIWRGIYGIGLIFCFIPLVSMLVVPESPRWLLMAGRVDDAKKAMQKLHTGSSAVMADDTGAEFYQMTKQAEHDKEMKTSWSQIVRLPADRRRAALAAGFAFLAQSTAILGASFSSLRISGFFFVLLTSFCCERSHQQLQFHPVQRPRVWNPADARFSMWLDHHRSVGQHCRLTGHGPRGPAPSDSVRYPRRSGCPLRRDGPRRFVCVARSGRWRQPRRDWCRCGHAVSIPLFSPCNKDASMVPCRMAD